MREAWHRTAYRVEKQQVQHRPPLGDVRPLPLLRKTDEAVRDLIGGGHSSNLTNARPLTTSASLCTFRFATKLIVSKKICA